MCYSVVGMMGQAQQVSNSPNSAGVVDMSCNGSPPASSSGYASYSSPPSDLDGQMDELDMQPVVEESPPPFMHSDASPLEGSCPAFRYSGGVSTPCSLAPDYDPTYTQQYPVHEQPPYCQQPPAYAHRQPPYEHQANYGSIRGSDFCYSYYPQVAEFGSPKTPNHALQHTMCRVCGDTASGNHFGVQSCEACKSFFRRSIRANARYACRGNRSCAIEKHTRNRCQYCRLQKCVAMGMRKEAVQEERTPSGAKLQRAGTPQPLGFPSLSFVPPPVPYIPNFDSPTSPVPRLLSQSSRMYGSLPNLKMEFERPGTSQLSHPGMASPAHSYTPPMENAMGSGSQVSISTLVNADMQSEGAPEEVKLAEGAIKIEDLFEGIRSSLLKVIEWAKRLPAFVNLSLDDQVKLLKASWCEHCTLKLAACNGPKSEMVLLGNGVSCKRDQIEDPEVRRVFQRTFTEVAYWLDYLNVDRVEMACLKGIILFNPDAKGLSPSSRKKVEIYQEQILQSLETRTKSMYPVSPQRFSKLLLRLAPLKAIALEVMQHMEVQRALGNTKMDNLFGELLDFE